MLTRWYAFWYATFAFLPMMVVAGAQTKPPVQIVPPKVIRVGAPSAWNFRNHVLPVLTKATCNSGACHGAAAGKGGLKLTLRGFDPAWDFNVLTRQSAGRRVVEGDPKHSLFIEKPTMQIGHGGGERIKKGSIDYQVLS